MRLLASCLVLVAVSASAQQEAPASPPPAAAAPGRATPQKPPTHSGAPLGQFSIGPLIVTPTFKIGTLGLDTNVFYNQQRKLDFVAAAGPGLDLSLPFLDHWKFNVASSAQYFYFYRTKELRRWTGLGTSSLFWATTGTRANVTVGVNRDFSRPSFEVDSRIARTTRMGSGEIERDLGRLTLGARASYELARVDEGQFFRGADISTALTTDRMRGDLQLEFWLTPLSALLFEGGYEETHFPKALLRNFAQENAGAGIKSAGFFKGQVTAGVRRARLLQGSVTKTQPYLRGEMNQQLGRRFRLDENYSHDSSVSAFATDGGLPTYESRILDINLGILLTNRLDLKLGGSRSRLLSDGFVSVIVDSGKAVSAKRDDLVYVARADLGFRLGRTRTSVYTSYTTRDSYYFADFGIRGMQAGVKVEYAPPQ